MLRPCYIVFKTVQTYLMHYTWTKKYLQLGTKQLIHVFLFLFLHFWESLTMSLAFYGYTPPYFTMSDFRKTAFWSFFVFAHCCSYFSSFMFFKNKKRNWLFLFFVPEDVTRILHHLHLMKTSLWSFCLHIPAIDFTFGRSLTSLSHTFLFDCLFLLLLLVWRGRRRTRRRRRRRSRSRRRRRRLKVYVWSLLVSRPWVKLNDNESLRKVWKRMFALMPIAEAFQQS